MTFQIKNKDVDYEVPGSLDPDTLWEHMLKFLYRGTLTLKNFENGKPCESWDAMYHTGHFLSIAAMRLRRTGDQSIVPHIIKTLDAILEQGINFRGFNNDGEYWRDYLLRKYYPIWGDKEVFRDTSRDQILSMNYGLYFIFVMLRDQPEKYGEILNKVVKIVKMAQTTLTKRSYDLGTTYGDCRTYQMPFDLCYSLILSDKQLLAKINKDNHESSGSNYFLINMQPSKKSIRYFRLIGYLVPLLWKIPKTKRLVYFTLELTMQTLFLIANCYTDGNKNVYPEKVKKRSLKAMKHIVSSLVEDNNLYFEILYYYSCSDIHGPINKEEYMKKLDEIFEKFDVNEPKKQDFIWQRHPNFRYSPREEWKGFYAPYHDYLAVYELIQLLG